MPFKVDSGIRVDDTIMHQLLRESLTNCLVNADYYSRQGLVIIKKWEDITRASSGKFQVEIDVAKSEKRKSKQNLSIEVLMIHYNEYWERSR